jgi:hypothetical protein
MGGGPGLLLVESYGVNQALVLLGGDGFDDHKRLRLFLFVKGNEHESVVLVGEIVVIRYFAQL